MSSIIIGRPKVNWNTITNEITIPNNLRKYFTSSTFFASYDEKITADDSILNVPAVSAVLPLAWIMGVDIQVDAVDGAFIESMRDLQMEYSKIYPKGPFRTKIIAKKVVGNNVGARAVALTFSGGLDSMYSLVSNIEKKPRLIFMYPFDISPQFKKFGMKCKSYYSAFAKEAGLTFNYVNTNVRFILKGGIFPEILGGNFWGFIQQAVIQACASAPLSIGRFNTLLTSADRHRDLFPSATKSFPWSHAFNTTEKITWADVQVKYDGAIHRHEKAAAIREYLRDHNMVLRVCWMHETYSQVKNFNCSKCEKCLRTIAELLAVDMDPNKYGFKVDESTIKLLISTIKNKKANPHAWRYHWTPLKQIIKKSPPKKDLYGSKALFKWLAA